MVEDGVSYRLLLGVVQPFGAEGESREDAALEQ